MSSNDGGFHDWVALEGAGGPLRDRTWRRFSGSGNLRTGLVGETQQFLDDQLALFLRERRQAPDLAEHQSIDRQHDDCAAREAAARCGELCDVLGITGARAIEQRRVARRRRQERRAEILTAEASLEHAEDRRLQPARRLVRRQLLEFPRAALVEIVAVPLDHRRQQGFLVRIVIEQPAFAHAGGLRHRLERQVAGALMSNELLRRIEDAIASSGQYGRCGLHGTGL